MKASGGDGGSADRRSGERKAVEYIIRAMESLDWDRVRTIYRQGIEGGRSTFTRICPSWAEWDRIHRGDCRFVIVADGEVAGWAALSPTSEREAYAGVVEDSVYIDEKYRGAGFGTALLRYLCAAAEAAGCWSMYASVFADNRASIAMHKKCGYRVVGCREKIAKDRFDVWTDTVLMERRNSVY